MRTSPRGAKAARLNCEALEDRTTPAVAYALTGAGLGTGTLLAFDTATPTIATSTSITNLAAGDTLVGIDFRPQNGHLYGMGVSAGGAGTLYDISVRTGFATPVGAVGSITPTAAMPNPATAGSGFGFDFNPTSDLIRVVTTAGQSFRVDPNTAAVTLNDPTINGGVATADAAAYTNDFPNVGSTTLYVLDSGTDTLYTQNAGTSATAAVGTGLGVNFSAANGFDIVGATTAFAALTVGGTTGLYSVNLTTGTATLVGAVGAGAAVQGFAVAGDQAGYPAIALDNTAVNTASLLRFNTSTPGAVTGPVAITGAFAASGESLVGIAFRPATGQLFGLGVNAGTGNGTLYLIDPQTGASTVVGATGSVDLTTALPDPATASYGFDFNPTVDRIRVVTSTGLDFRVNPVTGTVAATDSVINGSGSTGVSGAAYTNTFGQVLGGVNPTTLYTLDPNLNMLFIQNPPNNGTQTAGKLVTLGGAALDFSAVIGFDIPAGVTVATNNAPATGFGFATLVVGGNTSLYRIDLSTGAATNLGAVSGNPSIDGFTLADTPGGTVAFQSATVSGTEGPAGVNVVLTRTATTGPQTVTVTVTGGTATAGTDFQGGPYTVVFTDNQATANLTIPFVSDGVSEGTETVVLTITSAPGGAISGQTSTTLSVTDTPSLFTRAFGTGASVPAVATIASGSSAPTVMFPYAPGTAGGVRVALGDVNGDGITDLVTVPSAGAPLVKVFSGRDGTQISSFLGYPAALNIPASLAVGDVNNDGFADIVLGTTTTVAAIVVYSGKDNTLLTIFFPFAALPIGVNVALGDVDGNGQLDYILGTTSVVGAVVVLDGQTLAQKQLFFPFGGFPSGVSVAAGDLDGDGTDEIIVGTTSLASAVGVFKGATLQSLLFPFAALPNGVNVAVSDVNGDGQLDIVAGLATGVGAVASFDGKTLALLNNLFPFGGFSGGIYVA